MKLVLIVSEIIMLSSFLVFYPNLKAQNRAKVSSETIIIAEAVPPDRGSPSTRGKGKGRGRRFHEDRTKQIEFL
ncbi:MAG: hypothetical protein U7127_21550 [Phormidium sp.]